MPLLSSEIAEQVKQELADLAGPVRLLMFTQEFECEFCAETRQLVEEIAALSDQVTTEVYNFVVDKEKAEEFGIDKIPAIAALGAEDYGVRFYGIPSGYEFVSLLHAIKLVAAGKPDLSEETVMQTLRGFYEDEPFVRVVEHLPGTKDSWGTNFCDITARIVRGRVLLISCLDNLIKGASGAAVQNFNLMYGHAETTAL